MGRSTAHGLETLGRTEHPRSVTAKGPLIRAVVGIVVLIAVIVGTNLLFLANFRENSLHNAEVNLARHALTLGEQADRSFQSLDLVLSSVGDYIGRKAVKDGQSFRRILGDFDTHRFLKEKISGLPQVDAVTLIDANGTLLNFSRSWPAPDLDVSDRDFFRVLKADANLESFVSNPVRNRIDGAWVIYLARRVSAPSGEFTGLILGAVSLQYFENFFQATSLGEGSSVSLFRADGTLLARFPHSDRLGLPGAGAPQRTVAAGGILREVSRSTSTRVIRAARMLPNYPLVVVASQSEQGILVGWRRTTGLLIVMSAICIIVILIAAFVILRWSRALERAALAAETANQTKSSFLAMMSHEIRTPMNAVLGLTSILMDTELTSEQRGAVTAIYDAGDALLEILNDILDFSKLECGQLGLEAIAFSPDSLVHNVVSILQPRASAKGLAIRTIADAALPPMLSGDAGRIRQMLLNLVSNAVKFTAAGEVVIAVRCKRRDAANATVEWAVSDTGIGIPPERIRNLFKDFVQADSSISRRFGGSGLGLAICKRLVQQMDGEISVVSALGQGSTFRFSLTLPVAEQTALTEAEGQNDDGSLGTIIAALGRPLRILVTDDNATNRLVAAKMLKDFNIQINMACDGAEAVEAACRFPYDAILMDMRMPEMDGLQATRAIRSRGGRLATVPIIAFTANAFAEDVLACRNAGMDDFLVKPVRKKVLVETLARVLATASTTPSGAADMIDAPHLAPGGAARGSGGEVETPVAVHPIMDRTVYDELVEEIGEETVCEMLDVFVQETVERLALLRGLSCPTGCVRIAREAHSLKGTAGTFGLMRLAEFARGLEAGASGMNDMEFGTALGDIETAFETARTRLPARFVAAT